MKTLVLSKLVVGAFLLFALQNEGRTIHHLADQLNSPKTNGVTIYKYSGIESKSTDSTCVNALGFMETRKGTETMDKTSKTDIGVFRANCGRKNATVKQDGDFEVKLLSVGVERAAAAGMHDLDLIGRVTIFDMTVNMEQIGINLAVGADTGLIFTTTGLELKVLGIGGKVAMDGVQWCFVFCVGFKF